MDPNILLQRFEYLKFSKDRLSKFPDLILNSILSHLPTKEAIRTSVLSTRWQHIWTSLSHIDLNDLDDSSTYDASFFNFVERVLLLHDSSNIKSFRLCISNPSVDPSRVHSWLSAFLKHNIKEIVLWLPDGIFFPLPCSLFTCQSLVVLKIAMHGVLKVPTVVRFPHLKTLDLSDVILLNEDSIERLLSNCPVLQDLVLACSWMNIKRITISIPSLKRFSFVSILGEEDYAECTIAMDASNLVSLHYASDFVVDCNLYNLPSSFDAMIAIVNLRSEVFNRVLGLLDSVREVKSLAVIGIENLQAINLAVDDCVHNKLTSLRLDFGMYHLQTFDLLMDFLDNAPILEILDIKIKEPHYRAYPDFVFSEDHEMEVVPRCFESHLKTIHITFCNVDEKELSLLKLLLKHTPVLERMMIHGSGEDSELLNQLLMIPRRSEKCVIELLESDSHHWEDPSRKGN